MKNKKSVYQLLLELAALISAAGKTDSFFDEFQELLGFRIAWARQELAEKLCAKYGFQPEKSEIVIMQASGLTECHMHNIGSSLFLTLGKQHGFADPDGGTLFGDFDPGFTEFNLAPSPATPGKFFAVEAGKIHAFYSDGNGAPLTAIGFVSPRIRKATSFDVIPFEFVNNAPPYRVRLSNN